MQNVWKSASMRSAFPFATHLVDSVYTSSVHLSGLTWRHEVAIIDNTPKNRAMLFTCTSCEQQLPGSQFFCLTEKPALRGKTTIHLDNAGKVLAPYSRAPWRTRAIDTSKPCRACRARASVRASYARAKELTERIYQGAPKTLETFFLEEWQYANDERARLRVVIDQVASFTDLGAYRMASRLGITQPKVED